MSLFEYFKFKPKPPPRITVPENIYSGGDGSSPEMAIVINTNASSLGVRAEYNWIETRYGQRDVDWSVAKRSHGESLNGKYVEVFYIILKNGDKKIFYFDISAFFGKFIY